MMRHTLTTIVALSMLAVASTAPTAHAQESNYDKFTLGLDGMFVLPVGDWADITGIGVGALARLEYRLMDPLALTGRLGFIGHFSEDHGAGVESRTHELPILLGARYYSDIGVWAGLELGFFTIFSSVDSPGGEVDDTNVELGMLLSGGYRIGNVDVSAGLILPDIGDATGIFISAGFNFGTF